MYTNTYPGDVYLYVFPTVHLAIAYQMETVMLTTLNI